MRTRKGLSGGYNYLILSIVFITFFATGATIASESIEGISEITGVTPPSEIRACNLVSEELYGDDLLFQIGGGYPFIDPDTMSYYTSNVNTTEDLMKLPEGENYGRHIVYKEFEKVQSLENITYGYSNIAGGGNITIEVYTESTGVGEEYELVEQIKITSGSSDIIQTSYSVDSERIEKLQLRVILERRNTSYQPIVFYVGLRGEELDENIDYIWYKDLFTGLGELYSRTKQMAYCTVMQIANLFKAVTMTTGEWWMDMVLVPFQIVLLMLVIRVITSIVSSFPFT